MRVKAYVHKRSYNIFPIYTIAFLVPVTGNMVVFYRRHSNIGVANVRTVSADFPNCQEVGPWRTLVGDFRLTERGKGQRVQTSPLSGGKGQRVQSADFPTDKIFSGFRQSISGFRLPHWQEAESSGSRVQTFPLSGGIRGSASSTARWKGSDG